MTKFVDEAIDEALGSSKKKWALAFAAFVAGAAVVVWLQGRANREEAEATTDELADAPSDETPPKVPPVQMMGTNVQSSIQRVRDELNRRTRAPMSRRQSAPDAADSPPPPAR
jgi:hypothetical protein